MPRRTSLRTYGKQAARNYMRRGYRKPLSYRKFYRYRYPDMPFRSQKARARQSIYIRRGLASSRVLALCAREYLKVLASPFDSTTMPCNLWSQPIPSTRLRCYIRGTLDSTNISAGTPGTAAIACCTGFANDVNAVCESGTLNNDGVILRAGNATFQQPGNAAFNGASFSTSNGQQYMFVMNALRIRYSGTADTMSGSYIVIEMPSHKDALELTPAKIMALYEARTIPVSNDWTTIVTTGPKNSTELQFNNYVDVAPAYQDAFSLVILIRGVVQAAFDYEFISFTEVTGSALATEWSAQDLTDGAVIQKAAEETNKTLVPELDRPRLAGNVQKNKVTSKAGEPIDWSGVGNTARNVVHGLYAGYQLYRGFRYGARGRHARIMY